MSQKISWLITDFNITVNYNGQTHIVPRSGELAKQLIDAVKNNKLDEIPNLVSTAKRIEKSSNGSFTVVNGKILINGVEAPTVLGSKILKFSNEGLPFGPLVKFAQKLQNNPSFRAVNELYSFLEKNDHPITESGNFIAYKRVRSTFMDIHSNTMDNSVGNVLEVSRNQVDEDSNKTCSFGLHVANWHYAHTQFASSDAETDIMLEVEVDPANVVAIPSDYDNSKMRVCKYKVLGIVDKEHSSDVLLRQVEKANQVMDNFSSTVESVVNPCIDCERETGSPDIDLCDDCEDDSDEDEYPWEDELY